MGFFDMIKKAFAFSSARKLIQENPILKPALLKANELKHVIGENVREQLISELITDLYKIIDSKDQVIKCREYLAKAVLYRAAYGVLLIPPEPNEDQTGLRGTEGVTGKLRPHLFKVSQKDKILKRLMYASCEEPEFEDALHVAQLFYRKYYFLSEVFNSCRRELSDFNPITSKDWYHPFIHAMYVLKESEYRFLLEMPSAIPYDESSDFLPEVHGDLITTIYSNFYEIVLSGVPFPDLEWKERFLEVFEKGMIHPVYFSEEKDDFIT